MEEIQVKQNSVREPIIAGVLSFFFLGLGQAYNGQRRKGYMFIAGFPLLVILYFVLHTIFNEPMPAEGEAVPANSPSYIITAASYFCIWLFNIYDAYRVSKKINAGEAAVDAAAGRSVFIFLRTVILCSVAFFVLMILIPVLVGIFIKAPK